MKAVVNRKYVCIEIANLSLKYKIDDPRVRVRDKVVFWQSPLLPLPIPIPISNHISNK